MEYVYDLEEWRLKRLHKAIRLVCAILGLSEPQLSSLIVAISDNKGELHVLWRQHHQTTAQELAFLSAWKECGENIVRHAVFTKNNEQGVPDGVF